MGPSQVTLPIHFILRIHCKVLIPRSIFDFLRCSDDFSRDDSLIQLRK